MGGLALNKFGIQTIRLNREDFLYVQNQVIDVFKNCGITILDIPFYSSKDDFGDCDLLAESPQDKNLIKDIITDFWTSTIYINDGVYSFGFPLDGGLKFQVDIISRKYEDLDIARNYFSYNDLNNLIGRTAHHMGLKHGHCGLEFPIRQKLFDENTNDASDHVIKVLNLSKDYNEILTFLGFDIQRYYKGFETLEDIYKFACSTPYFCGKNFQIENLNHQNRVRNKKRKVFMGFLKWLEENPNYDKNFQFGDKKDWIDFIDKKWPIKEEIETARINYIHHKQLREKFNGNLVRNWVGLEGKDLGKVLKEFEFYRGAFSDFPTFESFIEHTSPEKIKEKFLSWYNQCFKK